MLMKALRWKDGARRYKFTQIPELIHCLLVSGLPARRPQGPPGPGALSAGRGQAPPPRSRSAPQCTLQKEPNCLASLFRQKVILVIVGLR